MKKNLLKPFKIISFYARYKDSPADELISETFKYLIRCSAEKQQKDVVLEDGSFIAPDELYKKMQIFQKKLRILKDICLYKYRWMKKLYFICILENFSFLALLIYWLYLLKANPEILNDTYSFIKDADLVCFSGGGIFQSTYLNFWTGIFPILKYCDKNDKKVYFNAIGIEKPKILLEHLFYKYLLNIKCVFAISTRDDIEYLQSIIKDFRKCKKILDPALWTKECYRVEPKKSDIIGIGVIRPKIFFDNGLDITVNEILEIYANLILHLENSGYKWQLFSNGNRVDYKFGQDILKHLEKDSSFLAPMPETDIDLVNTVSQYKAIIASRLHANVIATSLDIPSVGIIWNKKLESFSKYMKFNWNYIDSDNFRNVEYIKRQLESAIIYRINKDVLADLKNMTENYIDNILKKGFQNV